MTKYTALIEQLEQAETRDECVAAFKSVAETMPSGLFNFWYTRVVMAKANGADDYEIFGYMLLAAKGLIPEGWKLCYLGQGYDESEPWGSTIAKGSEISSHGVAEHPFTALAAACLKAMDAQDE